MPPGRCCGCESVEEGLWECECGVDDMDRAPAVAELDDGVVVCLFACDADSEGGVCCRKAARKDDRKNGR